MSWLESADVTGFFKFDRKYKQIFLSRCEEHLKDLITKYNSKKLDDLAKSVKDIEVKMEEQTQEAKKQSKLIER